MTYYVNEDGTIKLVSYDEEPNTLESDNAWLNQWNEEHSED